MGWWQCPPLVPPEMLRSSRSRGGKAPIADVRNLGLNSGTHCVPQFPHLWRRGGVHGADIQRAPWHIASAPRLLAGPAGGGGVGRALGPGPLPRELGPEIEDRGARGSRWPGCLLPGLGGHRGWQCGASLPPCFPPSPSLPLLGLLATYIPQQPVG